MCATKETCSRIRPLALEIIGFWFFQMIHQTYGIVPASSLLSSLFICCSCHGFLEPGQVNHSILVRLLCVLITHLQPVKGPELLQNCIISLRILVTGVSSFRQKFLMNSNPIRVDHLQFSRAPHDIWIWKGEDKANNPFYQGAERHFVPTFSINEAVLIMKGSPDAVVQLLSFDNEVMCLIPGNNLL
jgi:hypothetical protein